MTKLSYFRSIMVRIIIENSCKHLLNNQAILQFNNFSCTDPMLWEISNSIITNKNIIDHLRKSIGIEQARISLS